MPPLLDITNTDAVIINGVTMPTSLIRAIAVPDLGRVRIECDDASTEEMEVRRDPSGAIHFTRDPRSSKGTEGRPTETVLRAELIGPLGSGQREWVARGGSREAELLDLGWKEEGRTRPRPVKRVRVD